MAYNTNTRIEEYINLLDIALELKNLGQWHNKEVLNDEITRYKYMIEIEEKKLRGETQ